MDRHPHMGTCFDLTYRDRFSIRQVSTNIRTSETWSGRQLQVAQSKNVQQSVYYVSSPLLLAQDWQSGISALSTYKLARVVVWQPYLRLCFLPTTNSTFLPGPPSPLICTHGHEKKVRRRWRRALQGRRALVSAAWTVYIDPGMRRMRNS